MEHLDQLLKDHANVSKEILKLGKQSMQDKTLPLEDRWALFVKLTKAGVLPEEPYGDGHVDMLGDGLSLYDDFYIERYETTTYPEMYRKIIEDDADPACPPEQLEAWQEKVLSKGYGSFTYDW